MASNAHLTLHLPLHYYCFDGLGFSYVCLHLHRHALYFLWMDFYPCVYTYTGVFLNDIHKDDKYSTHGGF